MFCSFGLEACGFLASQPGIEPSPNPALGGGVLSTGSPGKSLTQLINQSNFTANVCALWISESIMGSMNVT